MITILNLAHSAYFEFFWWQKQNRLFEALSSGWLSLVSAKILLSQFSENPSPPVSALYRSNSSSHTIPQVVWYPGLPSASFLLRQVSSEGTRLPVMAPLAIFHALTPPACALSINPHLFWGTQNWALFYTDLSFPLLQLFLHKICFYSFNYRPLLAFFDTSHIRLSR